MARTSFEGNASMKTTWFAPVLALFALAASPAHATLAIFATVPEWGALARELGGEKVSVYVATNALQDPHHVEAKPSLIAKARGADLVVATGAELEIGWLPLVVQQAGNPRVRPGQPGYFEAAAVVPMLEKPTRLDRAEGDVHPMGNPHIQTDPRNVARVAASLSRRLATLDPPNAGYYQARYSEFDQRWRAAIARWEKEAAPLRGVPVVVQHKAFPYLLQWLGMQEIATLEPKPGVEPTVAYMTEVLGTLKERPARMVIRAAYQNGRASQWFAERANLKQVVLPFTVGGDEQAETLTGLFDDTIARLLKALQ
jgi:zinc/manganese transport system substrate-binding protein